MMKYTVLTLFPNIYNGFKEESIIKRAIDEKLISLDLVDFRNYSTNKHHTVDDYAYAGGAGMLISVEPVHKALVDVKGYKEAHKILLTPSGTPLTQAKVKELSQYEHLIIICGHYEGFDERVASYVDEEISIGDYILMGGEIPSMAIIEATARLVPGVISSDSLSDESFNNGLLEYPQYTRPATYDDKEVPLVLQNGDHAKINKWRRYEALKKTYLRRPELLKQAHLTLSDYQMLEEIKNEKNH